MFLNIFRQLLNIQTYSHDDLFLAGNHLKYAPKEDLLQSVPLCTCKIGINKLVVGLIFFLVTVL